jgi:hypothetical protein
MIRLHHPLELPARGCAEHFEAMESTRDVEYFLLDLFANLLVDRTRSRPELQIRRRSGAQFEPSATKEQCVALQRGDAEPPPWIDRVVDPSRHLLFAEDGQQSLV